MLPRLTFILISFLLFAGCQHDEIYVASNIDINLESAIKISSPTGDLNHFVLPASNDYSKIPQDPSNPLNDDKVALGKFLFYETGIALAPAYDNGKETYSCASCHIPSAGFRPGRQQGVADGGIGFGGNGETRYKHPLYSGNELDVQGIRPLSVLNVAFMTNTLWNGQFGSGGVNEGTEELWPLFDNTEVNFEGMSGLESQNIEGMDLHRMVVNKDIMDSYGYTPYFDRAFPDVEESDRYSNRTASFAISAYLRTLFANEAPFQNWLKGDKDALNDQEKRGAMLFFGDAKCINCHNGPSFSANEFYALGVKDLFEQNDVFNTDASDKKNLGRGGFTGKEEDLYKFKVPQLYNLSDAPFYFHGSSQYSLKDVIEYKNNAETENDKVAQERLSEKFQKLSLTEEEKSDLLSFLENALNDPDLNRYMPETVLSGNCFPNNDAISRFDMGCE